MSEEESLPPHVEYWLAQDTKQDCYFNVGSKSGQTERIGAFKTFLIGYSEPFRAMLQDSELAEQGDISVVDIEPDTFRIFLKCLYMGLTDAKPMIKNLSLKKCCDLLYVADKYLVTQLKEKLIEQCLNTLSSDTNCIVSYINVACSSKVFMQEICLTSALSDVVQNQIADILSSDQFLQITDDGLLWILKLDSLDIDDEMSLWDAVLNWAKNKTNSNHGGLIRRCTVKLLKYIRFCSMGAQQFFEFVVPKNVLTGDEVQQICKYYSTKEMPNMKFICNVVSLRHHSDDSKLVGLPSVITFSFHVSEIIRFMIKRCPTNFEYLDLIWSLLVRRDITSDKLAFLFYCKGSKSNPSWHCSVRVTLTIIYNEGYNEVIQFSWKYFDGQNPIRTYRTDTPWSKVMDSSTNLSSNSKDHINTVVVALSNDSTNL